MDRAEFVQIVNPLALALRAEMDLPTWTAYHRALSDVPTRWLTAAVDLALRQNRAFMPKPGEIRALADAALTTARQAMTIGPCAHCDNTRWITVCDPKGVRRQARCDCWHAWQVQLGGLGKVAPSVPLLEAHDDVTDVTEVTV